jgi:hypothetical protein
VPHGAPVSSALSTPASKKPYSALPREQVNLRAVERDLPLFWTSDKNGDGAMDPDEVETLLFYPTPERWVDGHAFTATFGTAYASLLAPPSFAGLAPEEEARRKLVLLDLEQGIPTLVRNDLRAAGFTDHEIVQHVLTATQLVDDLYALQNGSAALAGKVPEGDAASKSLFRRNWGARCAAPKTEKNPACSAIPGAPPQPVDVYPASLQTDPKFCEVLEKRADATKLIDPFSVVRDAGGGKLQAVPYHVAYADKMRAISFELQAAAQSLLLDGEKLDANGKVPASPADATPKTEQALFAYLNAAARAFLDGTWENADEAWAKMNAQSSKWYLRIGADETYWEPCQHKAGFHVTFARIDRDSAVWQEKLAPVQQQMETTIAALAGAPYKERKVSFHLPDFIDILWNAGDDRQALGGVAGQSLPNSGRVAREGRGRTVAMTNLSTDPDSVRIRRGQAASLLAPDTMAEYPGTPTPNLLDVILHEATHNLGPVPEYTYKGRTAEQVMGGGLSQMMEELKAQTGGLYFIDFVKTRGLVSPDVARQAYTDAVVWAFGHVARGMYRADGARKAYGQLAAIQLGFLIDEGALTWDAQAPAANANDTGAFTIHFDAMPAAAEKLMKRVAQIKATNDRAGAEDLAKRYVDGDVVPQKIIAERVQRAPRASYVYAVDM